MWLKNEESTQALLHYIYGLKLSDELYALAQDFQREPLRVEWLGQSEVQFLKLWKYIELLLDICFL